MQEERKASRSNGQLPVKQGSWGRGGHALVGSSSSPVADHVFMEIATFAENVSRVGTYGQSKGNLRTCATKRKANYQDLY